MRKELQQYVEMRPDLKHFIREQPIWFKRLSREPHLMATIEQEAKVYYGQTFSQKVQKFQERIETAAMFMELMKVMGQGNNSS